MERVSSLPQAAEVEDNDDVAKAQVVTIPATVNGILAQADTDHYAFDAKKGQSWIIETLAAQAGSPADTKIEVLHTDGKPVARMLLQAVRDSYNNFRSVDANNPDIRLQNWEEMELNEYVYFNGDVMRIVRMPRGPDGGCFFYVGGGMRRAYFDTSATAHSLDEPCFVDLIRNFGDDDGVTRAFAATDLVNDCTRTHLNYPAALAIRTVNLFAAIDKTGGREIGAGNEFYQIIDCDLRIFDKCDCAIEYLAEIMRRDLCRHSDRDAFRAVHQPPRALCRQHPRPAKRIVIIRCAIYGHVFDSQEAMVGDL